MASSCAVSVQENVAGYPAVVLAKEAVYNAVCVGAFELHDYIDFSSWFRSALLSVRLCSHIRHLQLGHLHRMLVQVATCSAETRSGRIIAGPIASDLKCPSLTQELADTADASKPVRRRVADLISRCLMILTLDNSGRITLIM